MTDIFIHKTGVKITKSYNLNISSFIDIYRDYEGKQIKVPLTDVCLFW